ncbi:hypothetical protein J3A83DRAFT_1634419 [Scleroderma citrinum]
MEKNVMGPTGVGKSSFIQDSVPSSLRIKIKVGDSLKSETNEVQSVSWITEDGTAVKLVDTPGFDDSRAGMTDARVLKMIATFLTNEHGKKSPLAGLIYVHRISDTRMGGSLQRNLRIFQKICGPISLKNVVIVTTMWDMVIPEEGLRHEQELRSGQTMFKPLLDEGATMMPHKRTPKSAADVINHLLGKDATMTQIVRELMQEGKALESTAAGSELINDLQARLQKINNERETSKVEIGEIAQTEIVEEMRTMEQTMAGLLQELAELKRGIRVPMERYVSTTNVYGRISISGSVVSVTLHLMNLPTSLSPKQSALGTVSSFFDWSSMYAVSSVSLEVAAVLKSDKGIQIYHTTCASQNFKFSSFSG